MAPSLRHELRRRSSLLNHGSPSRGHQHSSAPEPTVPLFDRLVDGATTRRPRAALPALMAAGGAVVAALRGGGAALCSSTSHSGNVGDSIISGATGASSGGVGALCAGLSSSSLSTSNISSSGMHIGSGSAADRLLAAYAALGVVRGVALATLLWAALLVPAALLSGESRSYRSLPRSARVEWLSRVVSDLHAVFVTAGLYVAIFREPPDGLYAGGAFAHRLLFRVVLTLGLGYFTYDALLVICMRTTISSPLETLAHHAVVMLGTIYVLAVDRPLAYVWCGGMFLTEASTPFVNQRWFMAIRHRHQKRYKATGLVMTVAFVIVRPLGIPAFLWWMWNQPGLLASLDTATVRQISVVGVLGCGTLYVLNVYWTFLIIGGLFRALNADRYTKKKQPVQQVATPAPREDVKATT